MGQGINRAAAEFLRVLPRKHVSRALGHLADLPVPTSVLDSLTGVYIRAYDVDLSEAEVPPEGFSSFNSFFTRRLKPGARPLDADPVALLSPADGKVADCGPITPESVFLVKGQRYDVGTMLGDRKAASTYAGGWYCIIYLSPRDYHRVHAPTSGRIELARHVPGTLFPVNAIGEHVPQLFARNERVVVVQKSPIHGEVASILVGAVGVGRVVASFDESLVTNTSRGVAPVREYGDAGPSIDRGEELGMFQLGSTVVLFTTAASKLEPTIAAGDFVRMGQAIARRARS
jgi:phosphatidylserine decarboxylase